MSRIRIVKGTITKTTGGDHNIYSEGNIVYNSGTAVTETSDAGIVYGEPKDIPERKNEDFDIAFELDKSERAVVPFGILDYDDKKENPFFSFKYKLSKSKIDSLSFEITDENNAVIYKLTYLKAVIVQAAKKPLILIEAKKPVEGQLKTWDFLELYKKYALEESDDYTKEGEYIIHWDGFDDNDVYDSTRFNDKKLKAKITAVKGDKKKSAEVEFSTSYSEVSWTDVKIDKNAKRIDITLRVDLKDGGAKGLDCWNNTRNFNPPHTKEQICDWDKIPASKINPSEPIIKTRTHTFSDLERLTIEGLTYHWGRNKNHAVAQNVMINTEAFEVYVTPKNTEDNAMDDLSLVYNTNGDWMRSGNPGSATINPISWVGNLVSREAICYNVGYIKYSNGWSYQQASEEDIEFKETSAHEVGHEILKSYGGTAYSYGHKGSVNVVTQNSNENSTNYPVSGEIDIMPYYKNYIPILDRKRMVAAEKDVLGLIWLTKIKIK